MERGGKQDLTTGGILKKLLFISMPIMGTQLLQMAYNLIDMAYIGRVGSGALAATAVGGMYMWLSMGLLMIGRMGAEIGVSQSFGSGDRERAKKYSQSAMLLSVIFGILYTAIMTLFTSGLVGFFGLTDANVVKDAEIYLFIVAIGVPATMVTAVSTGTFNAAGNAVVPFVANSIGVVANLILDPIFIFALKWGVAGAAAATVIAQYTVCILILAALKKNKTRPFEKYSFKIRISEEQRQIIGQIFRWSLPIALESTLFCALSMLTTRMEASFGSHAIAASRVGSQVESLSWLIGGGFGTALIAFIGQNYGAKKQDRINKGIKLSGIIMLVWGSFVTLLLLFGGGFFTGLFITEKEIIPLGIVYFQIAAICQIPMNLEAVAAGAFKGTGKTIPPSIVTISVNSIRVVVAYILSRTPLGLYGVWLAIAVCNVFRCTFMWIWYGALQRRLKTQDNIVREHEAQL